MKISNDLKIMMLKEMMRIRQFEERACELYVAGVITGALHASNGQEAVPVGVGAMAGMLTPTCPYCQSKKSYDSRVGAWVCRNCRI